MPDVVAALTTHRECSCRCFAELPEAERIIGVRAVYTLDDALRGWGFTPLYDVHGDRLWREAQRKNDVAYRGVAVRFEECIYRRLLGSMLHECIHAAVGDPTKANYGILFGLPYAVPEHVPESEEEAFLAPFNVGEARAWVGVWLVGARMFGLSWDLRTARDIGTYCFCGGNALVPAVAGYRAVAHIDRQHHPERYYARGRRLEAEARAWFEVAENLDGVVERIEAAAAIGAAKRPKKYPPAEVVAKAPPKKIGRNEPCVCGSARKFKDCCALGGQPTAFAPRLSR